MNKKLPDPNDIVADAIDRCTNTNQLKGTCSLDKRWRWKLLSAVLPLFVLKVPQDSHHGSLWRLTAF